MAENTLCSECNGTGHISEGSLFVNPGEKPPESKTCPRCNGLGYVKRRFFVEYTFNSKLSDNVYWLPLFISADSNDEAFKIVKATKVAFEEYNENVTYTYPILDEGKLASQHIDQKYKARRRYKISKLDVRVWNFKDDIKPDDEFGFEKQLEFVVNNNPLYERDIAEVIQNYRFPVRVLRENIKLEFNEYLLINVVNK